MTRGDRYPAGPHKPDPAGSTPASATYPLRVLTELVGSLLIVLGIVGAHLLAFAEENECPPRSKTVEADTSRRGATTGEPDGHPAPAGADPHSRQFLERRLGL